MGRGRTRQNENAAVRGGSVSPQRRGGRRESAEKRRGFSKEPAASGLRGHFRERDGSGRTLGQSQVSQ